VWQAVEAGTAAMAHAVAVWALITTTQPVEAVEWGVRLSSDTLALPMVPSVTEGRGPLGAMEDQTEWRMAHWVFMDSVVAVAVAVGMVHLAAATAAAQMEKVLLQTQALAEAAAGFLEALAAQAAQASPASGGANKEQPWPKLKNPNRTPP
jgi:hypothetical protein